MHIARCCSVIRQQLNMQSNSITEREGKKTMKKVISAAAMICLGLMIAPTAFGASSCTGSGTASDVASGGSLFDSLLGQATFNGTNPAGTFDSCVFASDTLDPAVASDPGALTFIYQFNESASSDLSSISIPGFGGTIV